MLSTITKEAQQLAALAKRKQQQQQQVAGGADADAAAAALAAAALPPNSTEVMVLESIRVLSIKLTAVCRYGLTVPPYRTALSYRPPAMLLHDNRLVVVMHAKHPSQGTGG